VHNSRGVYSLTCCKANPAGIGNDISVPVRGHQQNDGRGHTNAADENADECNEPLDLQVWSEANLRPIVQGHASPHKTKFCVT